MTVESPEISKREQREPHDFEPVLTREQIESKKRKVRQSLEKARLLPATWKSGSDGKTRDEVIAALNLSLDELDLLEPDEQEDQTVHKIIEEEEREPQKGEYVVFGGIHVPICERPSDNSKWQAVPGKVFISGGKKFSEVRFVKDYNGLTYSAKPGELLSFSEQHKGQRLESVDTVLEGKDEIKLFNQVLLRLGELTREYNELNPDNPDYDKDAKRLSAKISFFTDPKKLKRELQLNDVEGVEDVDDFLERVSEIVKTQKFLRSLDSEAGDFVPYLDTRFKLTPFFERKIAEFATLVNRQLGLGNNAYLEELVKDGLAPEWEKLSAKGMTVIVGPRGVGKNKLTEFYCGKTNRPLFRYACSPDKEERDLTYDVELSDGEVIRIPTRILTAVTTENAVLELDELNLLRPNVAKFFNSLFDGDRAVFLNDQVVKAAKGVVFVGLMNPAEYNGVEDLPETIDDRSNIMSMGYPIFKETNADTGEETFTYDEALILKENVSSLNNFSEEDFIRAWNYVINGISAAISLDEKTIKIIKDLKNIVAVANRTREVAEAYKTRAAETRMERDISLRGSIEAAKFYSENHLWDADLTKMHGFEPGWNAAQYAVAMTYLPHTDTYRRGKTDRDAIMLILAESI